MHATTWSRFTPFLLCLGTVFEDYVVFYSLIGIIYPYREVIDHR
jgi:hypothetical protein